MSDVTTAELVQDAQDFMIYKVSASSSFAEQVTDVVDV